MERSAIQEAGVSPDSALLHLGYVVASSHGFSVDAVLLPRRATKAATTSKFMRIFIFLLVLLTLLLPQSVFAHAKSTSYSTWEIDGNRVRVTARLPWIELQRSLLSASLSSPAMLVPGSESERELETYLTTHLSLFAEGQPCQLSSSGVTVMASSDRTRIARTLLYVRRVGRDTSHGSRATPGRGAKRPHATPRDCARQVHRPLVKRGLSATAPRTAGRRAHRSDVAPPAGSARDRSCRKRT